jgi:hypothetical protein
MEHENGNKPDAYDRMIGALHGIPDVVSTKASTVTHAVPMVGEQSVFTVQTFRQREVGDTVFLVRVSAEGTIRLAIPPAVADAIARQRTALTARVRSRIGKASAQARKDRGELPGFMRSQS